MQCESATETGIVGGGVIDGQATTKFFKSYNRSLDQLEPLKWTGPPYNCSAATMECRPRLVVFERCSRVLVRDVTLQNSPDWTSTYSGCENVLIDNVTVLGDYRWPNNDGIDPDSTLNMTISNSWIDVGDDAICPKARTGCKAGVQGSCYKHGLSNLLVVNNVARSRSVSYTHL